MANIDVVLGKLDSVADSINAWLESTAPGSGGPPSGRGHILEFANALRSTIGGIRLKSLVLAGRDLQQQATAVDKVSADINTAAAGLNAAQGILSAVTAALGIAASIAAMIAA